MRWMRRRGIVLSMRSKQTTHDHTIYGGPPNPLGNSRDDMSWERGSSLTAPPFGYPPELPLRRPGGPKIRPALSALRMPEGIARSLRRLRGLHLRVSLCRLSLTRGCDSRLMQIDDRSLIAEQAEDGSMIAIYIHPLGVSDDEAACGIATRLVQTLRGSAMPLGALRLAVLPLDAAAIDESDTALAVMAGLPSRPLLSLGLKRQSAVS